MKKGILGFGVILLFAALMVMGCTNADKGPAELAIKAAEQAVNVAKAEIGKMAPNEVAELEKGLASAKNKMEKEEYKAALTEAQTLVGKVKDVVAAAKAKAEEAKAKVAAMTQQWTDLSSGLPKMVEAIQSRVDALSKTKKLPAGLTSEKFAEAKAGLDAIKADWAKAQDSFKAGNLPDAVSVATAVKEKAAKAMEALGIAAPEAPKS